MAQRSKNTKKQDKKLLQTAARIFAQLLVDELERKKNKKQ